MGTQNLAAIRQSVRQILRDEFDVDTATTQEWQDDELDAHIQECLREISRCRPRIVKEVKTTIANSRVLDISGIDNLLWIGKLEYPTGNDPRDFRNFIELDEKQIEIDTTLAPDAGGSGTLTGIVSFSSGSAAITGSGTLFTTELAAGYHIRKAVAGSSGRWYRIYSITDDTHLTLAEPVTPVDTGADTELLTQYCYETVYLYCAKLHTLSEQTSTLTVELEELLVLGACGKSAISRARSLINAVNVGGSVTPSAMQNWGLNQLALYKQGLQEITPNRISKEYSKN